MTTTTLHHSPFSLAFEQAERELGERIGYPALVYDTPSHVCRPLRAVLFADDVPTDAPGDDCPDHGPYGDDECPKC